MFIFEIIAKLIKKKHVTKSKEQVLEEEICDHVYLAIDSSKEYLACEKCGNVIKTKEAKINPFKL